MIINNVIVRNQQSGLAVGGYGHAPEKISLGNIFVSNYIAENAWDRTPTPWGPAPDAQVNPAHGGAVSLDYWTNNIVIPPQGTPGNQRFGLQWDMAYAPQNASALAIFEPAAMGIDTGMEEEGS